MVVRKEYDTDKTIEEIVALFGPLTDEQRIYLAENIELRTYSKGEILYEEFDSPRYMMCLLRGKVMIAKNGIGNRSQIIRLINEEGFFGYRPAFTGEDYCTSATTYEKSLVGLIPTDVVKELIKNNIQLAIYFIKQLATLLGDADMLTVDLTQKHIRGRLAQSLLALKDTYGVADDGQTLNISVSRKDIASMSNMITNNAIRTLSAFASEGIINIEGKTIKIINEKELNKISFYG
ncbi:MAG: Crp/Fnr family transcriptional regulator [Prevotella sp.]|nr:Crp/Fnr family transcriptional regulator [Prevotella sp.]MBO5156032.1 Crp/Fnr family transcriptional regulator [Prevotella sp.]